MLKGKSVIELTDVKTNKKEVYEDENLVTNAVPDLLKLNPSGMMYPIQTTGNTKFEDEIFPISNKCYGGILLFENPLEEDINKYVAPSNNPITGYASNDVNQTDSSKRGSANLTESTPLENGYKFVWDFSTSQANGKISSLALTHYKGGRHFYGDAYGREACLRLNRLYKDINNFDILRAYLGIVEADSINNTFISLYPRENKALDIIKLKEPFTSIGLNDSISSDCFQNIEKTSIGLESFFEEEYGWNYSNFIDGKDGYWYGFNSKNTGKNVILRRVKIKKIDYSVSYDKWTLNNINLSKIGEYKINGSSHPSKTTASLMKNGYLYVMSDSTKEIYKINANNPVDITKIELGFNSNFNYGRYTYNYLYEWGDYILGYDFIINNKDEVVKNAGKNNFSGEGLDYIKTVLIDIGPFKVGYSSSENTLYKTLYLHTPYLGTINNLSSPILKTADKTMKITYTLTEEP